MNDATADSANTFLFIGRDDKGDDLGQGSIAGPDSLGRGTSTRRLAGPPTAPVGGVRFWSGDCTRAPIFMWASTIRWQMQRETTTRIFR